LSIIQDNLLRKFAETTPNNTQNYAELQRCSVEEAKGRPSQRYSAFFTKWKKMISLPKKAKIIQKKGNKAVFEIEGLYPGYGITIGNSLRRVLFSSLGGAAITQVKIKGVPHEFSTIKGVLQDVIFILLNLKKVRFKMYSPEAQIATLKVKGEKKVKASDFKLPPQVEIVNKDLELATITDKNTSLEMEIRIEHGVGYEPVETRKKPAFRAQEKLEIGIIALDAIYTPVQNVAFRVQDMRVGERTDYDRLILEIETDGTMVPEQAFSQACEILLSHFSVLGKSLKTEAKEKPEKPVKKKKKPKPKKPAAKKPKPKPKLKPKKSPAKKKKTKKTKKTKKKK